MVKLIITELLNLDDELLDLQILQLIVFFIVTNGPEETNKKESVCRWCNGSSVVETCGIGRIGVFVTIDILSS